MNKRYAFSLIATAVLMDASAIGAESATLKCEEWHPRLGQNPDRTFAIDLAAKTCNGNPCSISEGEFKWQEHNGRYEVVVNRRTGDGTFFSQGDLVFSFKNCALATGT
jgi:hypothetical protein